MNTVEGVFESLQPTGYDAFPIKLIQYLFLEMFRLDRGQLSLGATDILQRFKNTNRYFFGEIFLSFKMAIALCFS